MALLRNLGTHIGRRTVVTTLFVDGDEALEDIARFVGHARSATTAGYVKRLGRRPQTVAQRAAAILDGDQADGQDAPGEGSESPRRRWEQRWEQPPCTTRSGPRRRWPVGPAQTNNPGRSYTVRDHEVEVMGFEPTTSSMRPKRSSQLSYTPVRDGSS
jgi:hypothetical protein